MKLHEASHGQRVKLTAEQLPALVIGHLLNSDCVVLQLDGKKALTNRHKTTDIEVIAN
ncbi:hypothetical protein P7F88_25020 [Vibrio hannami]|uniref:hypothetical protein n=1 Tax=Vibrio hannami TaxID=2717094 RepID=UPI00240EAE10|nr:hypothetical protein [Vibrio hannami]MDG3089126.1 hypothetical protein [Vibrio hannami]